MNEVNNVSFAVKLEWFAACDSEKTSTVTCSTGNPETGHKNPKN